MKFAIEEKKASVADKYGWVDSLKTIASIIGGAGALYLAGKALWGYFAADAVVGFMGAVGDVFTSCVCGVVDFVTGLLGF